MEGIKIPKVGMREGISKMLIAHTSQKSRGLLVHSRTTVEKEEEKNKRVIKSNSGILHPNFLVWKLKENRTQATVTRIGLLRPRKNVTPPKKKNLFRYILRCINKSRVVAEMESDRKGKDPAQPITNRIPHKSERLFHYTDADGLTAGNPVRDIISVTLHLDGSMPRDPGRLRRLTTLSSPEKENKRGKKRVISHFRHGTNEKLIDCTIQPTEWNFLSSLRMTSNLICIPKNGCPVADRLFTSLQMAGKSWPLAKLYPSRIVACLRLLLHRGAIA